MQRHKPFNLMGTISSSDKHFFVGLKIYDPDIKHVAMGTVEEYATVNYVIEDFLGLVPVVIAALQRDN